MDNNLEWEKVITGICKFCRQSHIIQEATDLTESDINEKATLQCSCDEAKRYSAEIKYREERRQKREEDLLKAKMQIDQLFGDETKLYNLPAATEEDRDLIYDLAVKVYDENILKSSVELSCYIGVKISTNTKGQLIISRTDKVTSKVEV